MPDTQDAVGDWIDRVWHSVLGFKDSVNDVHWEELPEQLQSQMWVLVDRVTLNGTLLPDGMKEAPAAPAPAPTSRSLMLRSPLDIVRRHPYLFGAALSSVVGIYCYLRPPVFLSRTPGLRRYIAPRSRSVTRPRKLNDGTRLDAILVLGAERGGLGRELALDLERRGFIVLATVPDAGEIDALERLGRGHVKALVLDPTDVSTIPPLLRAISTALSLRFPLHSAGDPFRPAHQSPSLCSIVNCLALATHCSTSHVNAPLGPLEATPLASLSHLLQSRVVTSLGILQGTLPLLRSAPGTASVVTLVPASTSRVALPYVGSQSIADGALAALTDALRREVAGDGKVAVSTIDVGFFQRSHHGSIRNSVGLGTATIDLPPHLRAVYHPRSNGGTTRASSHVSLLADKVSRTIRHGRSGRQTVGAGSWTYAIASVLPTRALDALLSLQQRLAPAPTVITTSPGQSAPTNMTTAGMTESGTSSGASSSNGRRPLPTPPEGLAQSGYVNVKGRRPDGGSGSEEDDLVSLESSTAELS